MISMSSLSRRASADSWRGSLPIDAEEPGSPIRTNLDFYEYARTMIVPGMNLMLAKPCHGNWNVASIQLRRIIVQTGSTRGATIADGVTRSGRFVFILRGSDYAHPMTLNGRAMNANDMAVLPPGRHFALTSRGPHRWISLSVTPAALEEAGFSQAQIHRLGAAASLIPVPRALARQLADGATDSIDPVQTGSRSPSLDRGDDVERALLGDLFAAIDGSDLPAATAGPKSSCSLDRIGCEALALMRAEDGLDLHVEDLCRAIEVAERSLLRAFHGFFGIGPTQYMKLRRLNKVHHELQSSDRTGTTVTEAMTNCGVTEFGRFAGAYKALFGESPSETLRRKLETAAQASAESGAMISRVHSGAAHIGAGVVEICHGHRAA